LMPFFDYFVLFTAFLRSSTCSCSCSSTYSFSSITSSSHSLLRYSSSTSPRSPVGAHPLAALLFSLRGCAHPHPFQSIRPQPCIHATQHCTTPWHALRTDADSERQNVHLSRFPIRSTFLSSFSHYFSSTISHPLFPSSTISLIHYFPSSKSRACHSSRACRKSWACHKSRARLRRPPRSTCCV